MVFSISRQAVEASLLVSFAVLTVGFAGLLEQTAAGGSSNETTEGSSGIAGLDSYINDGLLQMKSIPFPGPQWLDRMAANVDMNDYIHLVDGSTYSSAYAAILYNDPLGNPCRNFNAWVNSIFFSNGVATWFLRTVCRDNIEVAHYLLCYLRNFLGAIVVYYGTASIFHYFCYVHPMSEETYKYRNRPTWDTIWGQIKLSQASMTIYTLLPVIDEWLVEHGYTKAYHTVDEIGGWWNHIATMILYFTGVEIGIYWMHRTLHTNKFLYKHVHLLHHQYKSAETLTPWASIAFHPLDGMLQASPYVIMMPLVPCHYLTHFGLLFFTAIWATYIHDAMDWNVDPIMGAKYHTVHHTHYIYNYGQVFIFCDWLWGTLRTPELPTGVDKSTYKLMQEEEEKNSKAVGFEESKKVA